jgi:hypothetical protein
MGVPDLRLASPSWLRLPRRTARLRLTTLYGALFLLTGTALAATTYALFERATKYRTPPIPKIPHAPAIGNLQLPSVLGPSLAQQFDLARQWYAQAQHQLTQDLTRLAGWPQGPFATQARNQLNQAIQHFPAHAQRISLRPRLARCPPSSPRPELTATTLARRPLRPAPCHLALWLNVSGAPAEVAARAGNSARVLHDVYLHCINGEEDIVSQLLPGGERPALPDFLDGMTWVDLTVTDPDPLDQLEWAITGRHPDP